MKKLILVLLLCLIPLTSFAAQQVIDFTWDASPTPTVTGYKMYMIAPDGVMSQIGDVNALAMTFTPMEVPVSVSGIYFFVCTAYDADGLESAYSNQVEAEIKVIGNPKNFKAVLKIVH